MTRSVLSACVVLSAVALVLVARAADDKDKHEHEKVPVHEAVAVLVPMKDSGVKGTIILKEEKDVDRAYNTFRKAHELDPRLLDAEREMRLINMRKEKEKSGGGFFDRFRKPHK